MRRKILSITLLALGIGLPMASPSAVGIDKDQVDRILAVMRDPMAILEGRSPGSRGGGGVQTKVALAPTSVGAPSERVLSSERPQPGGVLPPMPDAQLGQLIDDLIGPTVPGGGSAPTVDLPNPGFGGSSSSSGGGFAPPPVIFGSSGGSSGGGSSGGSSSGGEPPTPPIGPTPNPTPPISVPEPGTWLLLIVGIGMVGVSLRRRLRAISA